MKKASLLRGFLINGAPERIRTSDRLVRSQVLYPAELQARIFCLVAKLSKARMAVREGFEPSIRLQTVYSLSRGAPSASRPPHRLAEAHITFYRKYVKHFLEENCKNTLNRCVFNQSAVKMNFFFKLQMLSTKKADKFCQPH